MKLAPSANLRWVLSGLALFVFLWVSAPASYAGPIVLNQFASVGPNPDLGLTSWSDYVANALYALEHGLTSYGSPGPGYYATVVPIIPPLLPGQIVSSSGFLSWNGVVDPLSPYDLEHGNFIYFPLHILGNGSLFRLSNLYNDMNSSDPPNSFDNDGWFYDFNGYTIGIYYGPDGIKGTADDVLYNSGDASLYLINELLYVGVGASFNASGAPGGTPQEQMQYTLDYIGCVGTFQTSNQYCLYDDQGNLLNCTPEPGTIALLAGGLLGLLALRRFRKKR